MSECGLLFSDSISMFSGQMNTALNNTIKVPIILARELIQNYGVDELPSWVKEQIDPSIKYLPVLKKYSALKDSVEGLEQLPILFHRHASGFTEFREDDPMVQGMVKQIVAEDGRKLIRGMAYISTKNMTEEEKNRILSGEVIDVSVGGSFILGSGGIYDDGRKYALSQEGIKLRHVVILFHDEGRCPNDMCGVNLDKKHKIEDTPNDFIIFNSPDWTGHIVGQCVKRKQEIVAVEDSFKKDKLINDLNKDNSNSLQMKDQVSIMDEKELAKLLKKLEKLEAELADRDSKEYTKKLTEANEKIKDLDSKLETALEDIKSKDLEIETIKKTLDEKTKDLDVFEAERIGEIKDVLLKSKKWTEDELKDKKLKDMNELMKFHEKYNTSQSKSGKTLPKPRQDLRDKNIEKNLEGNKDEVTLEDASINMNTLYKTEGDK